MSNGIFRKASSRFKSIKPQNEVRALSGARILGTEFNKLVQALKDERGEREERGAGDVESRANVRYLGLDLHATYLP